MTSHVPYQQKCILQRFVESCPVRVFLFLFVSGPLHKHSLGHWNSTVEGLAQNVLKMYMEFDIHLYDRYIHTRDKIGGDADNGLLFLSSCCCLSEGRIAQNVL